MDVETADSSGSSVTEGDPNIDQEDYVSSPEIPKKKMESESQLWFQNAVNDKLKIPNSYMKVAVLVLRWNNDIDDHAEGHDKELRKLEDLFRDRFHYDYKEVKMGTSTKPQHVLNTAIQKHICDYDGPHNLLIIYYTGHGMMIGPEGEQELQLVANFGFFETDPGSHPPKAAWAEAETPLLAPSIEADVLTILDCCYAGNAHKGYHQERRIYELLAAAPRGEITACPGPNSFTNVLIRSLEESLEEKGRNFTTLKLQDRINNYREKPIAMVYDRLHKHIQRHVQLVPLEKVAHRKEMDSQFRPPEKLSIKIRFSLTNTTLSQGQIEDFARNLPDACSKANLLVGRIDWIEMKLPSASSPFRRAITTVRAMNKLKRPSGADSSDLPSPKVQKSQSHLFGELPDSE
ncbi:hypothetical protein BS50DRAFT_572468 [Corynespora cassiicola Philippines]|uniref:Uncharacterized protein n=1 Tax=Corynespora cassiicola Philippines TaxID=1448308 RepID=A0A2T2NV45_CORCC|nr:hypothetical protein BS50DRAFT_572468 [Corynespora cassiicola Philippines]